MRRERYLARSPILRFGKGMAQHSSWRTLLGTGLIYGLGAFLWGFVFGVLRQTVLIPQFGEQLGFWLEFPLVTIAVCILGISLVRKRGLSRGAALAVGGIGVALLLLIESSFAIGVLGQSIAEYLDSFDITKGELFPIGLLLMAIVPMLAARKG